MGFSIPNKILKSSFKSRNYIQNEKDGPFPKIGICLIRQIQIYRVVSKQ